MSRSNCRHLYNYIIKYNYGIQCCEQSDTGYGDKLVDCRNNRPLAVSSQERSKHYYLEPKPVRYSAGSEI